MKDLGYIIASELAGAIENDAKVVRGRLHRLVSLAELERALWRDVVYAGSLWSNIRLVHQGKDLHPSKFMSARIGDGLVVHSYLDMDRTQRYLSDGATLIYNHLHETSRIVQRIQESLEYLIDARVWIQAYLTSTSESAFGTHVDDHNFFVIQVSGSKAWTVQHPDKGTTAVGDEISAGEFVYVASNTPHKVAGLGCLSLHLTIAFDWLESGSRVGSHLTDGDRDAHRSAKRTGSQFPISLDPTADCRYLSFKFSGRERPVIQESGDQVTLASGGTRVRLDYRLAPALHALASGKECDFEELCLLSDRLQSDDLRKFLVFGVNQGLLYC